MASIFFPLARRRGALAAMGVVGFLAGCATPAPPPPAAMAKMPIAPQAVVLVARPLATPDRRGAVLLVLTGSPGHAGNAATGYDVIAQRADGSLKSCIAQGAVPPRPGSMVHLAAGAICAPGDIAAAAAIR